MAIDMMKRIINTWRLGLIGCCVAVAMTACSSDDGDTAEQELPKPEPQQEETQRTPVAITTRADAPVQGSALQAGLFMVNYQDGKPGELLGSRNYVDNQLMGWTGSAWMTETPIYWYDMETPADFYAYAPYRPDAADARQMHFTVRDDQRTDEAYAQSDLMWGCVKGQAPTAEGFDLMLYHQLSKLTVAVTPGNGFAEGELRSEHVSVSIGGTRTAAVVDLLTGEVALEEDAPAQTVRCHANGDLTYTAMLVPQDVPFSNLIQIDCQGSQYVLQRSFLLEAKRQYTLTVKISKKAGVFDIGIAGWDIIDEDFGGTIGGERKK